MLILVLDRTRGPSVLLLLCHTVTLSSFCPSVLVLLLSSSRVNLYVSLSASSSSPLIFLLTVFGVLQRVPLGDRSSRRGQHVRPVSQLRAGGVVAQDTLADGLGRSNSIVVDHCDDQLHFLKGEERQPGEIRREGKNEVTYLDLFEGHLEGEGLIVVRVQGALLDAGLLLFQPLAVLHDGNLHVGI